MNRPPCTSVPLLVVLSGPSGAGKDSVIADLRARVKDICYAVTMTTRSPRPGEIDGISYHFVSIREYEEHLGRGDLLAPAQVHGNWYGAPIGPVREAITGGDDVLLKIDVQGAIQLRRRVPQAVFIFIAPSSIEDLVERLESRRTESRAESERRMRDAEFEMAQLPSYDYVVVNREGCLAQAVHGVACIIAAERLRIHRQRIEL